MKLKFDSQLEYQHEAVSAVTDLFEGLPDSREAYSVDLGAEKVLGVEHTELGIGNLLMLSEERLLGNLHSIQGRNNVTKSRTLVEEDGSYAFPNFSVEMETGTGKTYVYLRTIFELNRLYGLRKFIVIVPSVAIREGVTSSIKLMRDHFRGLYDNIAFDSFVYNSRDLSRVRQFATNNEIQIMVINIQAFQKDVGDDTDYSKLSDKQRKKLNVIHQERDQMSGRRPIDFIRATNPVIIIDEPQSVDTTEKSQRAIRSLNPLLCFRYSATHTNPYNLLYKLDPIRAYDLRLVKQIEVVDASSVQDFNRTMVRIDWIGWSGKSKHPQAKATIFEDTPNGPREKQVTLKHGADLAQFTNRPDYEGYQVTRIEAEPDDTAYVEFGNGEIVEVTEETGGMADERMRNQIRQTVEEHFAKEKKFRTRGIKVLSLFFVDHVSSYRQYGEDGSRSNGKVAAWFEEIFTEVSQKPIYRGVLPYSAKQVHDGYFSADRKKGKIIELVDTSGSTAKDDETYELIMKDKERLLDPEEPLRFIFSHSALKEGWDNPNVFQICTLREMGTENERRQTLGRGLRLPVDKDGDRIFDEQVNRLTVIANETFQDYARGLQSDIEKAIDPSGGFKFGRLTHLAFTCLLNRDKSAYLTPEESEALWNHLAAKGLIDQRGDFTSAFRPSAEGFTLELPEAFEGMDQEVTEHMKRLIPREFVKDARNRAQMRYNKRVELNPEFCAIWDRISQKTQFSLEFRTEDLIARATDKLSKMPPVEAVRIEVTKRTVEVTNAGVVEGRIVGTRSYVVSNGQPLPDILAFLQRETELTRATLAKILKGSERLKDFGKNPQAFMTECAKLINRSLHELIIEGIKYEPIAGQFYEMRLFEDSEVEEYLDRLYAVKEKTAALDDGTTVARTPYDWVQCDSDVERDVAERLDCDPNVKFFCKLPKGFKVPTPLGNYTPDWAIVLQDDGALYLVRETKSTLDRDERRSAENHKVDCGKAHFKSLGVDFRDATNIHEVLEHSTYPVQRPTTSLL
ncbi:DEAD/DEAH box helicase family protein [Burkholderia sp. LMG 21824]|uniref:restriction endonuclease n=1 Tax=Burkholderia sp. LMG 21824 TaxID=3158172 RepID=UPI003C2B6B8C